MTTSWVIRETATKRVVGETWNPAQVRALPEVYEAVPIASYLAEINRAARESAPRQREVG